MCGWDCTVWAPVARVAVEVAAGPEGRCCHRTCFISSVYLDRWTYCRLKLQQQSARTPTPRRIVSNSCTLQAQHVGRASKDCRGRCADTNNDLFLKIKRLCLFHSRGAGEGWRPRRRPTHPPFASAARSSEIFFRNAACRIASSASASANERRRP